MRIPRKIIVLVALLGLMAACVPNIPQIAIPGLTQASPTPTECGCKIEGTPVKTPTGGFGGPVGPAQPGSEPTPTSSLSALKDLWPSYTSAGQNFRFEYPAVYDAPKYQSCAARQVKEDPSGAQFTLMLGSRTELRVFPLNGKTLEAVVAAYQAEHSDYRFDPPHSRTVGVDKLPGMTLPYRSGGTNRMAEVTFFVKGEQLYRVDTGVPSACDVPEIGLRELDAYSRLLDSFQ